MSQTQEYAPNFRKHRVIGDVKKPKPAKKTKTAKSAPDAEPEEE